MKFKIEFYCANYFNPYKSLKELLIKNDFKVIQTDENLLDDYVEINNLDELLKLTQITEEYNKDLFCRFNIQDEIPSLLIFNFNDYLDLAKRLRESDELFCRKLAANIELETENRILKNKLKELEKNK